MNIFDPLCTVYLVDIFKQNGKPKMHRLKTTTECDLLHY